MAADSDPLEMGPPADDNDPFPMGTGWRLINMGVNAPATARPDADSATEAPSEQPTDLGAMTDLGEVTDCEDVPTPPGVCKKEPMSPGEWGMPCRMPCRMTCRMSCRHNWQEWSKPLLTECSAME